MLHTEPEPSFPFVDLRARVAEHGEAPALTHGDITWTYARLDARASRLARWIDTRLGLGGSGAGRLVPMCVGRGPDAIAAMLAVLKLGAAYVPVDPRMPAGRIRVLLDETGADACLVDRSSRALLEATGAAVELLDIDAEEPAILQEHPTFDPVPIEPDAPCNVMFTSGSTGRPKGVVVPHVGVVRFLRERGPIVIRPGDVVLQIGNLGFDMSTFEIWGALLNGCRLVLVDVDDAVDPHRLAAIVRRERASFLILSTSVFNRHANAPCRVFDGVRVLMFGGEAASVPAVQALWDRGDRPEHLVNVYGPTENTILSTWFPIEERPPDGVALPIGRPVPGTVCRVVGPDLQTTPEGQAGELWVAGTGLAHGYLGRPEITAERFVEHEGQRWYRTGDVVQALATGDLVFVGRADNQIKIQGVRIELEEIGRLLERHPGVVEAQVLLERPAGARRLVAYLVLAPEAPEAEELRAFAMEALPAIMVPSVFRRLAAMPLTATGKTNRDALPDAVIEDLHLPEARIAPRDPLEADVHAVWARHLGVQPASVGVTCEFFASGGESLVAAAIASELGLQLGVQLGMEDLLRHPTVAELAEYLRTLPRRDPAPIPRVDDTLPVPLSASQEQIWLHQLGAPRDVLYNEPFDVTIPEVVDPALLEEALGSVLARHEALRSRVVVVAGRPRQHFVDPAPLRLPFTDLRHLPSEEAELEALEVARRQAHQPFDLAAEAPVRFHLVRLEHARFRLCVTAHHIAIDGVSIGRLLVPELNDTYRALRRGDAGPAPLTPRYRDVVSARRAEVSEVEVAWWKEQLEGYTPVALPTDRVVSGNAGGWAPLEVDPTLLERLRRLGRGEGTSLFHLLLAGWKALLQRHSGQNDITVAIIAWGRDRAGDELHVGNFLNTLALRTDIRPDAPFTDVLRRTRATCDGALAHRWVPYQQVVRHALRGSGSRDGGPVQIGFGLEPACVPCPWTVEPFSVQTGTTKLDLTLRLEEHRGALVGGLEYRAGLFDPATMERLAAHYLALLQAVVRDPGAPVGAIELADPAERERVLNAFNATDVEQPGPWLLHAFVEEAARRWPSAPAVVDATGSLDFATLDRRANRLAHHLVALGVDSGVRVAVWTERSADHVVGQLAVLKTGAAFLQIPVAEPVARARLLVQDASVRVVVHDAAHAAAVEGLEVVAVPIATARSGALPTTAPSVSVVPEDIAVVVYTSGSTGRPKGVELSHRAMADRAMWGSSQLGGGPGSLVLHLCALGFDAALIGTWWSFVRGAGTLLPSRTELLDPAALAASCQQHPVVGALGTPSLWTRIVGSLAQAGVQLDWALTGGEALTAELAVRLADVAGRVLNSYGPTEATIMATLAEVDGCSGRPPVGPPAGNVRAYVVDDALRPVPIGVPGELCIGGPGIAGGYLGLPELTARAFVPDPFQSDPSARMYRTGDIVRWLPSGSLDFLGRQDGQVKVRGFRVEVGEIEARIGDDPEVDGCAVALSPAGGAARLVAWVAGTREVSALRERLSSVLPSHMIPAVFVPVDVLPLTRNGKVDRRALPEPPVRVGSEEPVPRSGLERDLLFRFRQALRNATLGVDDDFFACGGDSLTGMELVADAAGAGIPLDMADLLRHRTVRALRPVVEARVQARAPGLGLCATDSLLAFREDGQGQPFFCVHPGGGSAVCYRALAEHVPGRPFYGLECVDGYAGQTVESMAAGYLERVRRVQPTGPLLLGGWSFGGIIAFEMARQAEARGETVALVALLDSRPTHNAHQRRFLRHMTDDPAALLSLIGRHLLDASHRSDEVNPFPYEAILAVPPAERRAWFLDRVVASGLFAPAVVEAFMARFIDDFGTCHAILGGYAPQGRCSADVLLLRATAVSEPYPGFPAMEVPLEEDDDPTYGWRDLTHGRVSVRTVGSTHENLVFPPFAERVGSLLTTALARSTSPDRPWMRGRTPSHDAERSP